MTRPQPDATQEPQLAALTALVAAQAAVRARLTAQAVALAQQAAQGFTGWYDHGAVTDWSTSLATRIAAVQALLAQTTDAYLARAIGTITDAATRPVGKIDTTGLRAGVTAAGAYGRAADVYRYQQYLFDQSARALLTAAAPEPFTLVTPTVAAAERAGKVAETDTQLAFRAQSQASMTAAAQQGTVTGYRRIIHPELAKGGTCGLCVAASDRLYGPTELLPLHAGCHCATLPVVDGRDPGSQLNAIDLRRLYKQAGGTHRSKLTRVRYQVDEHGELGATLAPETAEPRTAKQAARDTKPVRAAKSPAQKAAELRRTRDSLAQALPRAEQLAHDDPAKWGQYLTQLRTRVHDLDRDIAA